VDRFSVSADLTFLRVALDQEYCDWDTPVGQAAELALMPPVSGG
jgi:molybdopterin synthase sulfur carrier subunit